MKILDLLKNVSIDVNATCSNKDEAIDTLVSLMAKQGNLNDQDVYKQGIYAREELSTTGIGEGIAIPHAQSEAVNAPGLAAMVVKDGVDYQSLDNQPAKLFFMIAVPKTGGNEHLQILAMLSQMLMDTDFKDSLINAQSVEEFMDLINQKEAAQKAKEEEKEEAQKEFTGTYRLLAVTACQQVLRILIWRLKLWKKKRNKWELQSKSKLMVVVELKMLQLLKKLKNVKRLL